MSNLNKYEQNDYIYDDLDEAPSVSENNIKPLINGMLSRWYVILIIFVLGCTIGLPLVWYKTPIMYMAKGQIHIKPISLNIITGAKESGEISNYKVFMNTQASMMRQNRIFQDVCDKLIDKKLAIFDNNIDMVKQLRTLLDSGDLSIAPMRNQELIQISIKCKNKLDARLLVDAFIDAYMAYNVNENEKGEGSRLARLEGRQLELQNKIKFTRSRIAQIGESYGTLDLSANQDIMNNMIIRIKKEVIDLEIRKMNLVILKKIFEETKDISAESAIEPKVQMEIVNDDPRILKLIEDISEVERHLVIMEVTMAPQNITFIAKKKELKYLQEQLDLRTNKVKEEYQSAIVGNSTIDDTSKITKIDSELKSIEAYLQKYKNMLANEEKTQITVGKDQFGIDEAAAELVVQQDLLAQVIRRIQDVELENKQPARVKRIGNAYVGDPIDNRMKLLFGVIAGSLGLGIICAFLLFKINRRVDTTDDIIRCSKMPLIGTTVGLGYLNESQMSFQITEDYQNIRANINMNTVAGISPKILAISSSGIGEGKTTMAINLAVSMAKSGLRVLLIDGDFRKPDILHVLGLDESKNGLQNVLRGDASVAQCIERIDKIGLDVLGCIGGCVSEIYELLVKPKTEAILKELTKSYDHIIIDTAPILSAQDPLIWGKLADSVILTCFSGQTSPEKLEEAYRRLISVNIEVLGTVLNNVKLSETYYSYGYGYQYNNKSAIGKRNAARPLLVSLGDDEDGSAS